MTLMEGDSSTDLYEVRSIPLFSFLDVSYS
jgi:hypothetical protein